MAETGKSAGLDRVLHLKDRATRFAAAHDLDQIRPDLAAEEPETPRNVRYVDGLMAAIRVTGPVHRLRSVERLVHGRVARGLS